MKAIRGELNAAMQDDDVNARVRPAAQEIETSSDPIQQEIAGSLSKLLQVESIEVLLTLLLTGRSETGFGLAARPGQSLWTAYWRAYRREFPERAREFIEHAGPVFLSDLLTDDAVQTMNSPAPTSSRQLNELAVAYHNEWIKEFPDSAEIFLERLVKLALP